MEEIIFQVLEKITMLDPTLNSKYSQEQLIAYVELAYAYVSTIEGLDESKMVFAIALKTLSMVSLPENASLSKKKIKDVEIVYYGGQGKSKWDSLLDSFLNGVNEGDLALHYVGI